LAHVLDPADEGFIAAHVHDGEQQAAPECRHEQVRNRTRQRDAYHGAPRRFEPTRGHGHGLGPPDERCADGQQHARHQHGADGIQMTQRIQAQAAEQLSGAVPEAPSHPAVRDFVQRDRK
jgi:hypothetical protein